MIDSKNPNQSNNKKRVYEKPELVPLDASSNTATKNNGYSPNEVSNPYFSIGPS